MHDHMRSPGGRLGLLSVISTYILAFFGVLGVATIGWALIFDTTWWSDDRSNLWFGLANFAIVLLGAVGFLIMDRNHLLGATLAVIGGLALAFILVWAVVPAVLGVGAAVVAVLRARALNEQDRVAATSV